MTEDVESDPDPYEVTREELEALVDGWKLKDHERRMINKGCHRCHHKLELLLRLGLPDRAEEFQTYLSDGERLWFQLTYEPDQRYDRSVWRLSRVDHKRHEQLPPEKFAFEGLPLAVGTATYRDVGEEEIGLGSGDVLTQRRRVLKGVEIDYYSPPDDGLPAESAVGFFGKGVTLGPIGRDVDLSTDVPHWPTEDNAWRESLLREHGSLDSLPGDEARSLAESVAEYLDGR